VILGGVALTHKYIENKYRTNYTVPQNARYTKDLQAYD